MALGKSTPPWGFNDPDCTGRLDSQGLSYLDLWTLYNHPERQSLHL